MSKTKTTVMVDYPISDIYYVEDTEWLIEPDRTHDPGVLGAKPGAVPVNMQKRN